MATATFSIRKPTIPRSEKLTTLADKCTDPIVKRALEYESAKRLPRKPEEDLGEAKQKAKKPEGWRAIALGKELMYLYRKWAAFEVENPVEIKADIYKRMSEMKTEVDAIVASNYQRLCADYANLSNAYAYHSQHFNNGLNYILFAVSHYFIREMERAIAILPTLGGNLQPKWKAGFYETYDIFSAEIARSASLPEVCTDTINALKCTLAHYRLSALYSLAFTGDEDLAAFPLDRLDFHLTSYAALSHIVKSMPNIFKGVDIPSPEALLSSVGTDMEILSLLQAKYNNITKPQTFAFTPLVFKLMEEG